MNELNRVERYAIAVPSPVAAQMLGAPTRWVTQRLRTGQLTGVKLGTTWLVRRNDLQTFADRTGEVSDAARVVVKRWADRPAPDLPPVLDVAEVELLLCMRRVELYRLLTDGIIPAARSSSGWSIGREELLDALGAGAGERPLARSSATS